MTDRSPAALRCRMLAGALLFGVGVLALMGIITAESLYPGYSTSLNAISDLGATMPPGSIIVEPSATIFNITMMVSGLLTLAAAYCIHRAFGQLVVTVPLVLFGLGVLGVGIFPGNYGTVHALFALLAFSAGGVAAVAAYRVETPPLRYFSVALGAISLTDLALYFILGDASPFAILGIGGLERWIAYPILVWVTGFGGYLMGRSSPDTR
ncbi:hypothetical protein ABH15_05340 [Methanoculleus taiwanensis]|uniref:DUF998 domain-containing protein n=1 Tax=Methanoculleus taiwanensis TaxID=1550565 RepID=A0A498GZV9_9EURY|nr:DUF998 domain-containing protein [Methanoculleus taiwanensis]RXE55667.1 hypothetical protein ABH15_05340 [Methanoculleus taiwanensis]